MSVIAGVHGLLGAHRYSQEEIISRFAKIVSPLGKDSGVIDRIHKATEVKFRNLKALYTEGFKSKGWNSYSTINAKFLNQIVCTKK